MALSTTAYQTTTTAIVVTDMEPDGSFGPAVTVTVSPNPGPLGVSLTWTGGGGSGDPGRTSVTLDSGTGRYENVPLAIGPGTWTITATFPRQDYFEASAGKIVDLAVPLATWLTLTSNSPSVPGSSALLHASVHTISGAPLVPGIVTIRDAADAVIASGRVGGNTTTLDGEACCLTSGDYRFTATYTPDTADAFGSSTSWTHHVRYLVPSGLLFLNGGVGWTSSPIVHIHAEASVLIGTVTRMQVSNDGVHWHDHDLLNDFEWNLTDPALEGTTLNGAPHRHDAMGDGGLGVGPAADGSIEYDSIAPQRVAVRRGRRRADADGRRRGRRPRLGRDQRHQPGRAVQRTARRGRFDRMQRARAGRCRRRTALGPSGRSGRTVQGTGPRPRRTRSSSIPSPRPAPFRSPQAPR